MNDPMSLARSARENLAHGLAALQTPGVPPQVMEVAEPIAHAMNALHRIETTNGALLAESAPYALDAVRRALALLQQRPSNHPAVAQAIEAIAGSLGLVHSLTQIAAAYAGTVAVPQVPQVPSQPAAPPAPYGGYPQQGAYPQPASAPPGTRGSAQYPQAHYPQAAPAPQHVAPAARPPAPAAPQYQAFPQHQPPPPPPAFAGSAPLAGGQWQNPPPGAPQAWQPPPPPPQPMPAVSQRPLTPSSAAARPPIAQPPMAAPDGAIRVEAELGAHSATNFYKGLSGNDVIDSGGIFIATYQIPEIGQKVMIRVSMPGGYEFEALGIVRWTRDMPHSGADSPPGFGAQFTQISPEGRQLVYRYVRNREPLFHDDL